jgi:hypothetical protein
MKYKDPKQLSIFGDEPEEIPAKTTYHIYAVDKFDNTLEDDIEAVSWKQACYLFKKKHGFYWQCH